MSSQLIELLFFAGIALLIINKLITILGTTSEDDPTKKQSFFGEPVNLKDVTSTDNMPQANTSTRSGFFNRVKKTETSSFTTLIESDDVDSVIKKLLEVQGSMPSFHPLKFLRNAEAAFKLIIEAGTNNDLSTLQELVDKRYLESFISIASRYNNIKTTDQNSAKISDVYIFGNNVFIKVKLSYQSTAKSSTCLNEEWTFSRGFMSENPVWHLTNIDKL